MSTDKLEALSNTVAEILSEPPEPPTTFFDEEPHDAGEAGEQITKPSDNPGRGPEIPSENFGKLTSRKFGIAPNEVREARIARDSASESVDIARQALADQTPGAAEGDAGNQLLKQLSRLSQETATPLPDRRTASINTARTADSGDRISLGGWVLRGFAGILLAAGIGTGVIWLRSSGDAAKTAASQPPAALVQTTPAAAATSPELTPLLQSMARDLAGMGKEIEQLKAGRELLIRDNANLSEQLKASQQQLTRSVAGLSEQLKASQEQLARDNANVAEQIKGIQDQLARVISQASEQNARPKIAATPPRPASPSPRPANTAARMPGPTLPSAQAAAPPKPERPKPSPTPRPPAPAR